VLLIHIFLKETRQEVTENIQLGSKFQVQGSQLKEEADARLPTMNLEP